MTGRAIPVGLPVSKCRARLNSGKAANDLPPAIEARQRAIGGTPAVEYEDLRAGLVAQTDFDERPIRVLAFDDVEVLYDSWWPHRGDWGLRNLRGKAYYYRIPTQFILPRANVLRVDPLSEAEWSAHRPDLPLRLLRFEEFEWNDAHVSSIDAFSAWLSRVAPSPALPSSDVALDIPAVLLAPCGPKGATKRPVAIAAENGQNFSSLELLWRAASIQAPVSSNRGHGVGIYRLGCASARPLFYLWGTIDQAGFLAPSAPSTQQDSAPPG
jgi:hypothetical protein